jgi:hypothetical protein
MSSLNTVRLADGTELNIAEWLHWPLFSTIEIGAGDNFRLDAFSYVRGNTVAHTAGVAARNATEADTNLVRKKKMNQDEALVVFAITYEIFGLTASQDAESPPNDIAPVPLVDATDHRRLQRDGLVELLVGAGIKKPQVEATFSYISQGIGTVAWSSGDFDSIHLGSGGYPTPNNQRKLQLPVYIGGFGESARPGNSMHFKLRFRSPAGGIADMVQDVRIRWWLDGLRKRPA